MPLDSSPNLSWGWGWRGKQNLTRAVINTWRMQIVAVYGSLKKGFYNHRGLGDDAKFLGEDTVSGVMHLRGSYPTLTEWDERFAGTGAVENDHVIEVYEISDAAFEDIEDMEHGAGYNTELMNTKYGTAHIYYMPIENLRPYDKPLGAYTLEGIAEVSGDKDYFGR